MCSTTRINRTLDNLKMFLAEGQISWDALTFITGQVREFVLSKWPQLFLRNHKGALTPRSKNRWNGFNGFFLRNSEFLSAQ